jgi:hypothetical protein
MRNVVYVAPFPGIAATDRFGKALRSLDGIRLLGVFQAPKGDVARIHDDVAVVPHALDATQLPAGVESLRRRHGAPDRICNIPCALRRWRRTTRACAP